MAAKWLFRDELVQRLGSHTFLALFLTLVPSLVIGGWAAVAVVTALLF